MTDTICAISTALGVGAISIIRLSGPESIKIVNSIFKGSDLTKSETHKVHYGFIVDKNEIIDEVLVTVMISPKTFTTEDIVEINCHGGIATTNKILELLLRSGCRAAEGGEFTKRAFLNGRIDLVEAESIADLIASKTDKARKLALSGISGNLSNIIKEARKIIIGLRANIEVNIDYPEYEDELQITHELLKDNLSMIKNKLENILTEAENGKIIKEGINISILGRPNVGKSSILNLLLQEEKAIVTDIAGTTRDIVEGQLLLEGIALNLIDTAGIRETEDIVEKLGVDKSLKQIEKSDLIIYVLSNNEKITKEDLEIIRAIKDKKHILLINKTDLETKIDLKDLSLENIIYATTETKEGLNQLKARIIELFKLQELETKDFTYFSNARQIALVKIAIGYINDSLEQVEKEIPIDIIAVDIENCWNTLGEIIGETYKDELLDELFSNFCLGK